MNSTDEASPTARPLVDLDVALAELRPDGWRHVAGAAFASAMSSGTVTRTLGPAAVVLIVFTAPLDVLGAWATREQLIYHRGAVAQVVPHRQRPLPRPDRTALLIAAVAVYGSAAAALVSAMTGLSYPSAQQWWFGLFAVLYFANLLPDLLATKAWVRLRRPPTLAAIVDKHHAVMVYGVAAYPRRGGRGRELLERLHTVLDDTGTAAVLTARAQPLIAVGRRLAPPGVDRLDLVDLYTSLGYQPVPVRRPPADWPGRDGGRPYPGRRMLRLPRHWERGRRTRVADHPG